MTKYFVESKKGNFVISGPSPNIGWVQTISVLTFLAQNGSGLVSFFNSVSTVLFGVYKTEPKVIGKKIYASGGKVSYTKPSWGLTSESVISFSKGTQIGKATGNFWKSRSGQNMIEVEFTRVVNGSSSLDEIGIGGKAYIEIQDVEIENPAPVPTPTPSEFPLFKGKSGTNVTYLINSLKSKGYWVTSNLTLYPSTDIYAWEDLTEASRIAAGLPASFANQAQLMSLLSNLPQKGGGGGGGGGNDDRREEPPPSSDNTMTYLFGALSLWKVFGGKKKRGK